MATAARQGSSRPCVSTGRAYDFKRLFTISEYYDRDRDVIEQLTAKIADLESPRRPAWLETALFTAPAGNSPLS